MLNYKVPISFKELSMHKYNLNETFKTMVSEIKRRMPYLTLVYGYVNTKDPSERLQFMLIFSFDSKDSTQKVVKKYLLFIGNAFSYFSFEGFDICKQRKRLDDWFEDFQEKPVVYPEHFVRDIIEDSEGSLDKTDNNPTGKLSWSDKDPESYWKNPKNAKAVVEHLDKYSSMFYGLQKRK